MPLIAIPDIHGEADQLDALLHRILREYGAARLVMLGDYVDRGPDSARVLRRAKHLSENGHVCLTGNHEALLLGFLASDIGRAFNFAIAGGGETVASFAAEAGREFTNPREMADYLEADGVVSWLGQLPYAHAEQGVSFTHAPVPAHHWRRASGPERAFCLWNKPRGEHTADVLAEGIGAPAGHFAVCGHVVLKPQADGIARPAHFPHGAYLDCGCGSNERGRLVAAVFEDGTLAEFVTAAGRERLG